MCNLFKDIAGALWELSVGIGLLSKDVFHIFASLEVDEYFLKLTTLWK